MVRTLIVDAHIIVLEGIRYVFSSNPDIQIVVAVSNGIEVSDKATELKPELVIMDHRLPELDGVSVLRGMRAHVSTAKSLDLYLLGQRGSFHQSERARLFGNPAQNGFAGTRPSRH